MGIPIGIYQQQQYNTFNYTPATPAIAVPHMESSSSVISYHPERDPDLDITPYWRSSLSNQIYYNDPTSFPTIPFDMKRRVYSAFLADNTLPNLSPFSDNNMNIPLQWSLSNESSMQLSINPNDPNFHSTKNFNEKFWIFYNNSTSHHAIHIYDIGIKSSIRLLDLHSILSANDTILSIDCNLIDMTAYNLLVTIGLYNTHNDSIKFFSLNCDFNGSWSNLKIINLSPSTENGNLDHPFLKVYAGLAPNFLFSFDSINGLLITDLSSSTNDNSRARSNYNSNVFKVPISNDQILQCLRSTNNENNSNNSCLIHFPQLFILTKEKLWIFSSIFSEDEDNCMEINFSLKYDEVLKSLQQISTTTFVVTTNQRFFTFNMDDNDTTETNAILSTTINNNTILYKTEPETHDNSYQICASQNGKYIFISENHHYSTLFSIFERSNFQTTTWIFLGFVDVKSVFKIDQVCAMDFVQDQLGSYGSIVFMTNQSALKSFSVIPRRAIAY
ncbi:hypothetical protein NCAS_0A01120 [Naumovozyma castellii]|uniref:Uncharacterized protein n=1 Tax=Naumovozyma castellii TaxID=27288 RepID=G0V5D6_NAUCA|nr:hypothetical protein NCAS_0A01120 [Naumovozyma castellii CBS 4309]CCC66672.1 hypothetical protein NCAS_0A01120 [Naumovozyma castellii CBS 4309]